MDVEDSPGSALLSPQFQRGMSFADGWWCVHTRMDSQRARTSLDEMMEVGVDSSTLIVTWFQDNVNSTSMTERAVLSPTVPELRSIITYGLQKGLRMSLKLHVDMLKPVNGQWRGDIGMYFTPPMWDEWFTNYEVYIRAMASLAQETGTHQLVIGTELMNAAVQTAHWRKIIAVVKSIFKGKLIYAANFVGEVNGKPYSPSVVEFWDELDFIGVDAYYSLAPENSNPTFAQLQAAWTTPLHQLKTLSQSFNKSVIFTEIGYPSQVGSYYHPNNFDMKLATDLRLQNELYTVFFETVAVPNPDWFEGVYWWAWWTDPLAGGQGDYRNLYTPQNKPSRAILHKYYAPANTSPAPPRDPSWKPQHCGVAQTTA
eukprot:TRINITY_DN10750_c0_g1_i2.p1 TRINITY_DN10750_c0_g1~~TRINITY_DN10750_c0_g1_i2.p1  ORF type:complete len:420 (-),score=89.03 TRINITY_DN10750_c0_g1_i2:1039-2148(-)